MMHSGLLLRIYLDKCWCRHRGAGHTSQLPKLKPVAPYFAPYFAPSASASNWPRPSGAIYPVLCGGASWNRTSDLILVRAYGAKTSAIADAVDVRASSRTCAYTAAVTVAEL
jgi:hypothetical protein